jgi:hypothetical protein
MSSEDLWRVFNPSPTDGKVRPYRGEVTHPGSAMFCSGRQTCLPLAKQLNSLWKTMVESLGPFAKVWAGARFCESPGQGGDRWQLGSTERSHGHKGVLGLSTCSSS